MARTTPNRRRRAEHLVADTRQSLPVDLGQIAAVSGVHRIQFKQLLTDGGLAVEGNGFVIYVRCGPGEEEDFTSRFADDGTGRTLPKSSRHRARFTIAHEIAHTLFYDLRKAPPAFRFRIEDDSSATKLEIACNTIAGTLVLPETLMPQELLDCDSIGPEVLRRLADQAMVSDQAIIRRFKQLRRFPHPEGMLASVSQRNGDWVIDATSCHYSLRELFSSANPELRFAASSTIQTSSCRAVKCET